MAEKTSDPLSLPLGLCAVLFLPPLPWPGRTHLLAATDFPLAASDPADSALLFADFFALLASKIARLALTLDSKTSSSSNQPRLRSSRYSISSMISSFRAIARVSSTVRSRPLALSSNRRRGVSSLWNFRISASSRSGGGFTGSMLSSSSFLCRALTVDLPSFSRDRILSALYSSRMSRSYLVMSPFSTCSCIPVRTCASFSSRSDTAS
mmetsp:Transcript_60606/g.179677  ORF Transcript_60606/g.179677 Transcript_60606/m.179677 type:complete len:209 (+) Transcript_60606:481-1107(+)